MGGSHAVFVGHLLVHEVVLVWHRHRFWYMEVVEMLRKFLLTGLPLATTGLGFMPADSFITAIFGGLIIALTSILYADCAPYRHKSGKKDISLCLLCVHFLCTLCVVCICFMSFVLSLSLSLCVCVCVLPVCTLCVLVCMLCVCAWLCTCVFCMCFVLALCFLC